MESWITRALPSAVAYAASLLGDRQKADDVVQECVCRLLMNAARYDLPRDGQKLLMRSITNSCINAVTRDRKLASLDELGRDSDGTQWDYPDEATQNPSDLLVAEELRELVCRGLAELPVRQRSAIELWSLGYRTDEIAEMLSLSASNVRVTIHRARNLMHAFLKKHGVEGTEG